MIARHDDAPLTSVSRWAGETWDGGSSITEDGGSQRGGGLGLHAAWDVLVDVHSERDAGVAEAFADNFGVDALLL